MNPITPGDSHYSEYPEPWNWKGLVLDISFLIGGVIAVYMMLNPVDIALTMPQVRWMRSIYPYVEGVGILLIAACFLWIISLVLGALRNRTR